MQGILSKLTISTPVLLALLAFVFVLGAICKPFFSEMGKDLYGWLKRHWLKRTSKPDVAPGASLADPVGPSAMMTGLPRSDTVSSEPRTSVERISRVTYQEIRAALERSPPLQQPLVTKQYEGVRVQWDGTFSSAQAYDSFVRVRMKEGGNWQNTVRFHVALEDYPELKVLHEGHQLRVVGTIKEVELLGIDLTDAELTFLD